MGSRTRGKEAVNDRGPIEFVCNRDTVWIQPPISPDLHQLPLATIMQRNKQSPKLRSIQQ